MIDYFLLIKNSTSPKRSPGQTTLDQIEPKWRRAHDLARPLRLWEEKLWRSRCPGDSSNLAVLMIVLKGAGKETPTSLPRTGGGKYQHWITLLCHLDDHDHHKGNDHYHLSRQALTASELLLLQREAAENPGNVREKKLKKIRPFFKNPLHSLRK